MVITQVIANNKHSVIDVAGSPYASYVAGQMDQIRLDVHILTCMHACTKRENIAPPCDVIRCVICLT